MKVKILIIALLTTSSGLIFCVARASTWGINGFAWIGNQTANGDPGSDPPVTGTIKFSGISQDGSAYGVTLQEAQGQGEGKTRLLSGSAWLGIGGQSDPLAGDAQNDLPSLGWIQFDQTLPDGGKCFGAGDCYAAKWNKKPGSGNSFEGYLSGWARFAIGSDGSGTAYPETWVHFKAPSDLNKYSCDPGSANHYYVCAGADGKMSGYAWSGGASSIDPGLSDNPGFGWISFSNASLSGELEIPPSPYCITTLDPNNQPNEVLLDQGGTASFYLKAYYEHIDFNPNNPGNFSWTCNNKQGWPIENGEQITCNYQTADTFTPTLSIKDSAGNWNPCLTPVILTVKDKPTCKTCKVIPTDSNGEPLDESLGQGQLGGAYVEGSGIAGGKVNWDVTNGTQVDAQVGDFFSGDGNNYTGISPSGGADTFIGASVNVDGEIIECIPAEISVKEKLKWN